MDRVVISAAVFLLASISSVAVVQSSADSPTSTTRAASPTRGWAASSESPERDWATGADSGGDIVAIAGPTTVVDGQGLEVGWETFVRAYSLSGTALWTDQFASTGQPRTAAIGVADDGTVVVATNHGFVRVYSAEGSLRWSTRLPSSGSAPGVAAGGDGTIVVAMGGITHVFSAAGVPRWTDATVSASSVAIDGLGNVITAGSVREALPGETLLGESDGFIRVYSPTGAVRWTDQFGGPRGDRVKAVAADQQGYISVTGSTATMPDLDPSLDGIVRAYSPTGELLWTDAFLLKSGEGVARTTEGNTVVGGTNIVGGTGAGGFVRSYSRNGALLWDGVFNPPVEGNALALDRKGNPYLAGRAMGPPVPDVINRDSYLLQVIPPTPCALGPGVVVGTAGRDHLTGTPQDDVIIGLGGDDVIYGLAGDDVICGGTGNDRIFAGSGDDFVRGGRGHDRLRGGDGVDRLFGHRGNDLVDGRRPNESPPLGDVDHLDGGEGSDRVLGGFGDDRMLAGPGHDRLVGSGGDDTLDGGPGDDTMIAGRGDDLLAGDAGHDILQGKEGDDDLDGGRGPDRCNGGPGTNTFVACELIL